MIFVLFLCFTDTVMFGRIFKVQRLVILDINGFRASYDCEILKDFVRDKVRLSWDLARFCTEQATLGDGCEAASVTLVASSRTIPTLLVKSSPSLGTWDVVMSVGLGRNVSLMLNFTQMKSRCSNTSCASVSASYTRAARCHCKVYGAIAQAKASTANKVDVLPGVYVRGLRIVDVDQNARVVCLIPGGGWVSTCLANFAMRRVGWWAYNWAPFLQSAPMRQGSMLLEPAMCKLMQFG